MIPPTTIGTTGISQLGLPIVITLLNAGFRVVAFRRGDREAFVAQGRIAFDSPAEVLAQANFILTCRLIKKAQMEVMEGPRVILAALHHLRTVIEMNTYDRSFKEHLASRIERTEARILESGVGGSPPMVIQRKAALFLGGTEQLSEHCLPVLQDISDIHLHIGEFGSAVAMKLIANYLLTIHTLAAAEAMNLGDRAGFSAQKILTLSPKVRALQPCSKYARP
ncbi:NAD(P)-dependent oxidoreductase [Pseudomonas yamanorum]|uniref:NAD(P)-dependent oxidoreductase n=1 Tax=Pseudomonas yamanorum TaxID=515393 RepID=A0A7Y8K7P1_9PSED|nr:NAD(P)-binding domain-containing protein [Pseudomonas yamanorum]NWE77785.1 NAD(P)-dependent oxidoreductase [Pseudomonas yamanorum]